MMVMKITTMMTMSDQKISSSTFVQYEDKFYKIISSLHQDQSHTTFDQIMKYFDQGSGIYRGSEWFNYVLVGDGTRQLVPWRKIIQNKHSITYKSRTSLYH